jgi:hypothetical protein
MSVEIKKFFFLVAALVLMSCSSDDDDWVHCDATDSCSEDSSGKNTEPDQNSVDGEDEIDPDRAECYSKAYPFQSTMNVKALWPAQYYDASASGLAYATLDYTTCDSVSLKSVGLKVTQLSTGKSDSVPAVFVRDDHSPRKLYFGGDASVRLDTVWGEALPFANGDYLFEWDFVLESYVDDEIRESHHYAMSKSRLDGTLPGLLLQVPSHYVRGTLADANWANVRDTLRDGALRAIRAYVVDLSTGDADTLFYKAHINAEFQDLRWNPEHVPMAEGRYAVVVQAYDYADPDMDVRSALERVGSDSGRTSWDEVLDSIGSFVPGINGVTLSDTIWVKSTPPSIVDGSLDFRSVPDTMPGACIDSAELTLAGYPVYNACNRLSLSFEFSDSILNMPKNQAKIRLVFSDSATNYQRVFKDSLEWDGLMGRYEFDEPPTSLIRDGMYSLTVELEDFIGNVFSERVADTVVFDRISPAVDLHTGFSYKSDSTVGDATAIISQATDNVRNISAISCKRRLDTPDSTFQWTFVRTDSAAATANDYRFSIPVKDWAIGRANGRWHLYVICYDAAGNARSGVDFFEVGE